MNRKLIGALVCALAFAVVFAGSWTGSSARVAVVSAAGPETHLMRYPDISKDSVVFTYAGDLWVSPRAGGAARRLTAHPGDELFPKFSPDGKWIAFSGEYDGNMDVYVIPSAGGEPKRLTYHPAQDLVLGWTPDGKKILFRSASHSPNGTTQLFLVSPDGGLPEQLPLARASLTSYSPDGQKVAFLTSSQEFRTWKRYRGGWSPAMGIYDLKNNTYEQLPKNNTMDLFPMWHGNSIYYINDATGVMNLYRYDLGSKKSTKLTDYKEYDIKWPSLGPDAVVYENGGLLYAYEIDSGKISHITVNVASDDVNARAEIKSVGDHIRSFTLSPTGVRALFEARGEIFTVPVENGSTRNLTSSPGVHELSPVWSPDGKWIAYLSDRSGEYEIYTRPQLGGDETRVTSDGAVYRFGLSWSPDNKKILFYDKSLKLWYVDIAEKKSVQIDQDDFALINDGAWSPDSRWVAYSKTGPNFSSSLYLYSLEQKKVFHITNGFYNDGNPSFDPDGKALYFMSQRFFYPSGGQFDARFNYYSTTGIFGVTLKADEASPFAPQSDDEKDAPDAKAEPKKDAPADAKPGDAKPAAPPATPPAAGATPPAGAQADKKPEEKKPEDKKDEKKPEDKAPKPIQVDVEGIEHRIFQVPVPAGLYRGLQVRKDKLFYVSAPIEATQNGIPGPPRPSGTLHLYDLKARKDAVLLDGINSYDLNKDGSKVIYHAGPLYGVADAAPGRAKIGDGRLNTASMQALVDPRAEWAQMFHEAWRIERDFYWDPKMGGADWEKIGKRYEALLPWVAHRSDLSYILGELIAELSTSHTYVGGGDFPDRNRLGVGLLGVDFDVDHGFYRLKKVYHGENWNPQTRAPLDEPGLKVMEGDYLISVNGVPAKTSESPYAYFQGLPAQLVTLKVNNKPGAEGAWDITVRPIASESQLRYLDWVEGRRKVVSDATGGRIGYMHVPDTAISGVIAFDKYLGAQLGKDGMIIDERFNAGGFIPDFFTEKLGRRILGIVAPRDGKDIPISTQAIYGPKVMLINELAGSGGDAFPYFFKRQKLGPLVGTRTWGGLVGIGNVLPLMDGGAVTAPGFGFWVPEDGGKWIVENHGVDPDYVVDQRPDLEVKGQDPQLQKAIDLAMQGLKDYKPIGARPAYPKKN
jgi:tricorn protease